MSRLGDTAACILVLNLPISYFAQAYKMKQAKPHRNWVAKNAKSCGAGQHKPKSGKFASRARQKEFFNRSTNKE